MKARSCVFPRVLSSSWWVEWVGRKSAWWRFGGKPKDTTKRKIWREEWRIWREIIVKHEMKAHESLASSRYNLSLNLLLMISVNGIVAARHKAHACLTKRTNRPRTT